MKYSPKEEEESSEDLIFQLLNYRKTLQDNQQINNSYEKQFKEIISTLLWKHTEAYGKYKGCKYWSLGAIESLKRHNNKVVTNKSVDPTHALRHEHLFPRKQTIELLLSLDDVNKNSIHNILKLNIGVVVTVEEDSRLSKLGNKENPWQRYIDAGIQWKEV
jgi:hypothetical protein